MKELAIKIQQVMDTMQQFDMKPTYDNCNYMMGCLQALAEVRNALAGGNAPAQEAKPATAEPEVEVPETEVEVIINE